MWELGERVLEFFTAPELPVTDLFGDEATMKSQEECLTKIRAHMRRVSYTLAGGVLLVLVAVFTPWGIVLSSDLADKVEAAVKTSTLAKSVEDIKTEQQTMKTEVNSVKSKIDSLTPMIIEVYKASTAQTICRMLSNKLRADADKEQDKYKMIAGEYYPESRCGGN